MFAWEHDLTTDYITRSQNAVALLRIGSGPLSDFLEKVHPEDRALRQRFAQQVKAQGSYTSEFRYSLPSGEVLWFGSRAKLTSPDRMNGVTFDITDRKSAEEEIWRTANHDSLTGLIRKGRDADAGAARHHAPLVGEGSTQPLDDALRKTCSIIERRWIRHEDGKLVSSEPCHHIIFANQARKTRCRFLQQSVARIMAQRIVDILEVVEIDQQKADAGLTPLGLRESLLKTVMEQNPVGKPSEPAELMKSADIALYRAKAQGRNRVLPYSPAMRREIEEHVSLGIDLREALAKSQLVPFYQPKVSLVTGKVIGFEALARWQHPTRGFLTPSVFGAAFDDADLAPAIRRQLVPKVAADMRTWIDRDLAFGRIAINLSSADFNQPALIEELLGTLERTGVSADLLEVEITETVLLGGGSECVTAILRQFRDHGVQIALDDFGTGYASLMHLKHFPVDHVKIDRTFIQDLDRGMEDEAIVAVIGLGRSLNLQVTAEGVETKEQEHRLRQMGCDYAQGFLYAAPVAAGAVPSLLSER